MSWAKHFIVITGAVLSLSCSRPGNDLEVIDSLPAIFPDYCDVVIPVNIAPLNFKIVDDPEKAEVLIEGANERIKIQWER